MMYSNINQEGRVLPQSLNCDNGETMKGNKGKEKQEREEMNIQNAIAVPKKASFQLRMRAKGYY